MSDLGDVIDHLWLHSTFEEDPWCVERAFAAIEHDGEVAIDALVWALRQSDLDLKMLALRLVREFGPDAKRTLPAVSDCLSDRNRLVRITAMETADLVVRSVRL
jgi:2-oxo-4-hydroxy-4-carboxy--5-ureidoimidazoline (OHCU) decarboxylase